MKSEPTRDVALHPVQQPVEKLLRECTVRHERRRGPGGQHRNKTESAVVLLHTPTGIEGQAAERRSQHDNHRVAVTRLRVNIALAVRTASLAEAAPTGLWKSRCHDGKIGCSPDHEDFAPLLAEALDVLHARNGHLAGSAEQLGVTPSQLVKFLKHEHRALLLLNEERRWQGLHPLE
jgi:peptide chain release factor-like protein